MSAPFLARALRARILVALAMGSIWTLLLLPLWRSEITALLLRTSGVAVLAALLHALLERHPRRLEASTRRGLQDALALAVIPASLVLIYLADTLPGRPPLWQDPTRLTSLYVLSLTGVLLALPAILAARWRADRRSLAQQHAIDAEALVQTQAELHDAQLRLLRLLVRPRQVLDLLRDTRRRLGSEAPAAAARLDGLVDYLEGVLPYLNEPQSSLGRELEHVSAYLELLDRGAPGRLNWSLDVPPEASAAACPPRLLMVLVEQAVRLGIGSPERAGRLEIWARLARGRCLIRVLDDGTIGPAREAELVSLHRRLFMAEGEDLAFRYWQREGSSVVEIDLPHRPSCVVPRPA
ncbi:MAG: hypothetical protein KatS3mg126_1546 [Lysobacteraceae bacterium]|nr:MAG: hypothetical protein KatS3mg126_1546 [Xanthomonadaceae bacterium]